MKAMSSSTWSHSAMRVTASLCCFFGSFKQALLISISLLFYALHSYCSVAFGSDGICVIIAGAEMNFQFLSVCRCSTTRSTSSLFCWAFLSDITTFQAWKSLKSMWWIRTDSSKPLFLSICFGIDQEGHDNVNHIHTTEPYFHFSFVLLLLLAVKQAG